MKEFKVVHFGAYFPGKVWDARYGGVETYIKNLCFNLCKRGVRVTVFTSKTYPEESFVERFENLKVLRGKVFCYVNGFPVYTFTKLSVLKEAFEEIREADIIHGHVNSPFTIEKALFYSEVFDKPLVVTYQADPLLRDSTQSSLKKLVAKAYSFSVLERILRRADKIVATTLLYSRKSVLLHKFADKVVVIPNGVDTERFKPSFKKKSERCVRILFVGRLVKYKGVKYLPAIADALRCRFGFREFKISVAGEGSEKREVLDGVRKFGVEENFEFLGAVPHSELPEVYREHDVFLLPSVNAYEGFGIVLAEAMASGLPVVSTNVGGVPEVVSHGHSGFLTPPHDVLGQAKYVYSLCADSGLRRKFGEFARGHVEKKFSYDIVTEKMLKLYREILENKR